MFIRRLRNVSTHRPAAPWRLVVLMPLLVTLLAACGKGTGGGPAY